MIEKMPIVKLSNGLRVANFSSPHEFIFEDGSILPACSKERAEFYKVEFIEDKKPYQQWNGEKWVNVNNISLSFDLSDDLRLAIMEISDNWEELNQYDIIIIPMPMLVAIKEKYDGFEVELSPFRVIKMKSRIDKVVRIDEFCV